MNLPQIKIDHNSRGLKGFIHTLIDWYNIKCTNKYLRLSSNAKVFYLMSHKVLEKKRDTLHLRIKYAQLTAILKANNAITYENTTH